MTTDFTQRTRHLALTYLLIIMTLSLVFSGVLYGVMSAQLDRPLPPPSPNDGQVQQETSGQFERRIAERDQQTRTSTIVSLAVLNIAMLGSGTWFSFYLARRTLKPIQASMEAQSQFISDASHELRTPLTALQTTNEVALRKAIIDDAKARQVLGKNIVEVGKLRRLTDMLLSLAQSENRQLEPEAVWLDELISDASTILEPAASAKRITLKKTVEHTQITTDRTALSQIITILCDNAIKYSPDETTVTLGSEVSGNSVKLFVRDQGIGIAPADQARIFDRFYRADAARTRSDTSGHGLGLAIAQSLTEQLGGKLTLESGQKQGTVFSIVLPDTIRY